MSQPETTSDFIQRLSTLLADDAMAWRRHDVFAKIVSIYETEPGASWSKLCGVMNEHGVLRTCHKEIKAFIRRRNGEADELDTDDPRAPIFFALQDNGIDVKNLDEVRARVEWLAQEYKTLRQHWPKAQEAMEVKGKADAYEGEIAFLRRLVEYNVEATYELAKQGGPHDNPTADEARIAWAFAHDDGSPDAGSSTAAMRNLEQRYGALVAKSLEGFVCMSMLTGRMRDVKLSAQVLRRTGATVQMYFEIRDDGKFYAVVNDNVEFEPGDQLMFVMTHQG